VQIKFSDGAQVCAFGFGTINGKALAVVSQRDDGIIVLDFALDLLRWTSGGIVFFEVDGGSPYRFRASAPGLDSGRVWIDNEGVGRRFLHDLYNGYSLKVRAGAAHATFSIAAGASAVTALHHCADAIMAAKNGYATAGASPSQTPLSPPIPHTTVPARPSLPQPAITEVPLAWTHGHTFTLLATLNTTTTLAFTLDTGASDVVIPRSVAVKLQLSGTLSEADYLGDSTYTLADGHQRRSRRYMLRSVTIGGLSVTDVECLVGDEGSSLLLGQSFLQKFASLSIDNVRGVLVLK
jgi:clan AA aspartic protease (TIGR02281 family)